MDVRRKNDTIKKCPSRMEIPQRPFTSTKVARKRVTIAVKITCLSKFLTGNYRPDGDYENGI